MKQNAMIIQGEVEQLLNTAEEAAHILSTYTTVR